MQNNFFDAFFAIFFVIWNFLLNFLQHIQKSTKSGKNCAFHTKIQFSGLYDENQARIRKMLITLVLVVLGQNPLGGKSFGVKDSNYAQMIQIPDNAHSCIWSPLWKIAT